MNSQLESSTTTCYFGVTSQDMMLTPDQKRTRRNTQTPSSNQESGRKSLYKSQIPEELGEHPLSGLTVYVEIFSNKVNISETAHSQLEALGAKIEKRMNKKCNLVIWKDGSPRTLQRAQTYEVPVVNSLWLADCVENERRADISKFTPSKTDQDAALFSLKKAKKRKRFALENLHSDTKQDRKHSRPRINRLSSLESHQMKKTKTRSISKKKSDSRVTVRLQKKTSSKKREVARSLSFDTKPQRSRKSRPKSEKKAPKVSKILFRSGSLHRRIIKTRNPDISSLKDLQVRSLEESEVDESVYSDEKEVSSPGSLDIEGILAERKKAQESSRIREMILRYASAEYPVAVETYNMMSDQDTNIDEENDFSVRSPLVRPFEHSGQPFNLESAAIELEFSQLQPDTGAAMLEEKDDDDDDDDDKEVKNNGIEIEEPAKEICETPPMDNLKPENANTLETPVTKAGSSVNKESIDKEFLAPIPTSSSKKKSSDMKSLLENIYSDFKGTEENKENSSPDRGRKPTREQGSERSCKYTLRSNSGSKEFRKSSSKDDIITSSEAIIGLTRQARPKKSIIVTKSLVESGIGKLKGRQNPAPKARVAMEEEKVNQEPPKRHNVMFSNLKRTELSKMKDFCDKYGLNYLEDRINNSENIEILVAEKQEIPQNFKAAMTMARGKAIVKKEWVINCTKKDKLLDFEHYMVLYTHDQRKNLFGEKKFYVDPEIEEMPINMVQAQDISKLITATGGIVNQNIEDCDFCIRRKTTKIELTIPSQTKAVTLQWLIDSVLEGKIMDTNNSNYRIG